MLALMMTAQTLLLVWDLNRSSKLSCLGPEVMLMWTMCRAPDHVPKHSLASHKQHTPCRTLLACPCVRPHSLTQRPTSCGHDLHCHHSQYVHVASCQAAPGSLAASWRTVAAQSARPWKQVKIAGLLWDWRVWKQLGGLPPYPPGVAASQVSCPERTLSVRVCAGAEPWQGPWEACWESSTEAVVEVERLWGRCSLRGGPSGKTRQGCNHGYGMVTHQ